MKYIRYRHHNQSVTVRKRLKGKHRKYCLCYQCKSFHPGYLHNCKVAQRIFDYNRDLRVTTPVWECVNFIRVNCRRGKRAPGALSKVTIVDLKK